MPLSRGLAAVLSVYLWIPVAAQTADPPNSGAGGPEASQDCAKCPAAVDAPPGAAGSNPCRPCPSGGAARQHETVGAKAAAPAAAAAALSAPSAAAAAGTSAGLGRTFDGGAGGATGGVGGGASYVPAVARAGGAQSVETRFSAAFNAQLASVLSAYPAGRETLDRQRAADGTLKLPPVALFDSGGSVLGEFDRYAQMPSMKLDQRNLAKTALDLVPPAERPALQRAWRDPSRLAAYLTDHPATLAALAARYDCTYVHELTHGWQARRDRPVDVEADVDPQTRQAREPIDWEIEAFREEMRYYHQKLMRDPAAIRDQGELQTYTALLAGYDEFHSYVTVLYSGVAQGSFPRIAAALAKRKNAAGVADMAANEDLYARNENDFIKNELPAIQRDGTARLVGDYEASGRPDKALGLLTAAPDALRAAGGPRALQETAAYLKSSPSAPLSDRLDAWQAYIAYLQKSTGANALPEDMFALYRRDYRAAYDQKMAQARSAATPAARREALLWAKSYAAFLPQSDQTQLRAQPGAPAP